MATATALLTFSEELLVALPAAALLLLSLQKVAKMSKPPPVHEHGSIGEEQKMTLGCCLNAQIVETVATMLLVTAAPVKATVVLR